MDADAADGGAARVREHLDAACENIDVNVQYVSHAISKVRTALTPLLFATLIVILRSQDGLISKKDFMRYFDTELAARIDMRDVTGVQARIKREDVEVAYDLIDELGTGQTATVWKAVHRDTGNRHDSSTERDSLTLHLMQVSNTPSK
jgi:hypothetical protein